MIALKTLNWGQYRGSGMKKIVMIAGMAGAVLALSACDTKEEAAPAEPAEGEMVAPVEEEAMTEAEAETEGEGAEMDPTGNPIGPQ